jgi:hypothetical protein
MTTFALTPLIWVAGGIHAGILIANIPLPRKLRVRENLRGVPDFLRQIFYVHWVYIVLIVGLFGALCFVFTSEPPLGRFLSAFIASFWLLRIVLQWFYYDAEIRRTYRWLDATYMFALVALVAIFGFVAVHPTE